MLDIALDVEKKLETGNVFVNILDGSSLSMNCDNVIILPRRFESVINEIWDNYSISQWYEIKEYWSNQDEKSITKAMSSILNDIIQCENIPY
jgi:hypothetical protein